MADVQEAPASSGLSPTVSRAILIAQHWTGPVWALIDERLSPVFVLFYQGVILIAFIAIPVLAFRWTQPIPGLDLFTFLYIPYAIGLVYLITSLWVFRLRRGDPAGRAFAVFSASIAFAVAGVFDVFTTQRMIYLWTLTLASAGGALFGLAMLFPQPIRLVNRWPLMRWAGYLPACGLVLLAIP
jgi:hypothetical protein